MSGDSRGRLDVEAHIGEPEGFTVLHSGGAGVGGSGMTDHSANGTGTNDDLASKVLEVVERKKKRRKKGNAIDELFAGLS